MDVILNALNESRQLTVFTVIQQVALYGGAALSAVLVAMAVCRDEVKAAMRMADISRKEAAITMGISEPLLSMRLSGEKPLTFESLAPMPAVFWQWFAVALAQRVGVPATVDVGARLARRQARMSLSTNKEGVA